MKKLLLIFLILSLFCLGAESSFAETFSNYVSCTVTSGNVLADAETEDDTFTCTAVENSYCPADLGCTNASPCRLSIRGSSCSTFTGCATREITTAKAGTCSTGTWTFTVKARDLESTTHSGDWGVGSKVDMVLTAGQATAPGFNTNTDCSSTITEGNVCWETDVDKLWVGDGAAPKEMGATGATGATGPAPDGAIDLTAAGIYPSTTSGSGTNYLRETTTNKIDFFETAFDASTDECAEASFIMPSDWDGNPFTAEFYWTHGTASSYDVVWYISCLAVSNGESIDQALGTAQYVRDTGGTAYTLYVSGATSSITCNGTSPVAKDKLFFRVCRDGNGDGGAGTDTLDVDAWLTDIYITFGRS